MSIPNDIVINITRYYDYPDKINMAKLNKEIYTRVYPELRYIIFWEDKICPSEYSKNIYLCKSVKNAKEKYAVAKQKIQKYGDHGFIEIDIIIDDEVRKYYNDKKLTALRKIIMST